MSYKTNLSIHSASQGQVFPCWERRVWNQTILNILMWNTHANIYTYIFKAPGLPTENYHFRFYVKMVHITF